MFCTTVIPTIGRPTLNRAVTSLLEQAFTADDFEIIVVNDSGRLRPGWRAGILGNSSGVQGGRLKRLPERRTMRTRRLGFLMEQKGMSSW